MPYNKITRAFRKQLFRLLYKLADKGCGDSGWCECLLCRVMRVVQTEQFRNNPDYKSSWAVYQNNPATTKTRMKNWRGGQIEFALGSKYESVAFAPWYAIQMLRKGEDESEGFLWWLDYGGPPQLYLTRKAATAKAKELRKQYCGKPHYEGSYRKVKVVKIGKI
jgi:hypothetical protein